jgi:hypothetical protein
MTAATFGIQRFNDEQFAAIARTVLRCPATISRAVS